MKPYALQTRFTTAAETVEEAGARLDQVVDFAADIGLYFEGGQAKEMRPADVVAGSPLAKRLRNGAAAS